MIKHILIIAFIFLILDFIFISFVKDHFSKQVFSVQNKPMKVNGIAAVLCYILLILGVYYFIIREKRSLLDSFLLGIFVYGVYELTTKSLLSDWKWITVSIDTLWGGILFASTAFITKKLSS